MSPLTAAIVSGALCGASMYLLAWQIHGKTISQEDVVAYMDRLVASEEAEAYEHRMRTIALRANRIAMPNPNSGPPARVSRGVMGPREGRGNFLKKN